MALRDDAEPGHVVDLGLNQRFGVRLHYEPGLVRVSLYCEVGKHLPTELSSDAEATTLSEVVTDDPCPLPVGVDQLAGGGGEVPDQPGSSTLIVVGDQLHSNAEKSIGWRSVPG